MTTRRQTIILDAGEARPATMPVDGLPVRSGEVPSPFGICRIADTPMGICHLSFADRAEAGLTREILQDWPEAGVTTDNAHARALAEEIFNNPHAGGIPRRFLVRGTPFQIAVWRALLAIPDGETTSYGALAASLHRPGASRAVGSTVAANPVALLIPCHRVLRADGAIGGYHWGTERKRAILEWESGGI